MTKAILVIDMPERCEYCPFMDAGSLDLCKAKVVITPKGNEFFVAIDEIDKRPEWCPLKPMPEKRDEHVQFDSWDLSCIINAEHRGYNKCIDKLLEETDEE